MFTPRITKKQMVNKIVEEAYWEGFFEGLGADGDDVGMGLEFVEHPYQLRMGLDRINGARKVAEKAGYEAAQQVIADAIERRDTPRERRRLGWRVERKIPGSVYAEAYGEARV